MKKKITLKDWTYIGKYNHAAKWLRPLCQYTLIKESATTFKREQRISWPVYIILFIPVHIIQALWCIWDGGLREFEISERYLGGDWLPKGDLAYARAEEIWNNKY